MGGDGLVEGTLDHRAQTGLKADVSAVIADELLGISDSPLHQPINHKAFLLGRENGAGIWAVEGLHAPVKVDHILERRRQLEAEPWLARDFPDLAQCVDDCKFTLIHDEQAGKQQCCRNQAAGNEESNSIHFSCPV